MKKEERELDWDDDFKREKGSWKLLLAFARYDENPVAKVCTSPGSVKSAAVEKNWNWTTA